MNSEQPGRGSGAALESARVPILEVRKLCKGFGNMVVVDDVSFKVYDGEFLFLIGPSGCGKTTTLRMIGGYETPTSGEILINGKVINEVPLEKRNIGMVFQNYALFPHMTVAQNVEFGLRMRGMAKPERREKVANALDLVELGKLADRYPNQLSGGQRQRVAIARVVVYQPDILLLDEPLANLDKRLRDTMRVELKKLQEKVGITSIYVTHDQEEALSMADRIAVMDGGKLLQVGAPREVYNTPSTGFVATFLGETTSFQSRVERIDADIVHVRTGTGLLLAARGSGDVSVGENLLVSIRPERIRLSRAAPQGKENVLPGTIDFVSYLGSQVVYMMRIEGADTPLKVSEPVPFGRAGFATGDRVFASWDPDQAVYLRERP